MIDLKPVIENDLRIFQPLYITQDIALPHQLYSLIIFLLEIIRKLKYSTMYNIFFINFEVLKLRFQDNNRVEFFFHFGLQI